MYAHMNIHKYFNKKTSLFLISIFSVALLYLEFLPDSGGNKQCSKLLGLGLEEEFGMEFIPQWKIKDFFTALYFSIFRYKASWEEYKDLENFLIIQGWHVREGGANACKRQELRAALIYKIHSLLLSNLMGRSTDK